MKELGRLSSEEMKQVKHDAPNSSVAALHTKLDEVIDALKLLAAADPSAAAVIGALEKIKLHL